MGNLETKRTGTLILIALGILWIGGIAQTFHVPSRELVFMLRMSSDTEGRAQLFVDDGSGFREERSAATAVAPSDIPWPYVIRLPVGRAFTLRLDPLDRPGAVAIEAVEVRYGEVHLRLQGEELSSWVPNTDLVPVADSAGDGLVRFRSTGTDPQIVLHLPPSFHTAPDWGDLVPSAESASIILVGLLFLAGLRLQGYGSRPDVHCGWAAVAGPFLPVALLWILAFEALGNWFMNDDPCHLAAIPQLGILEGFYKPSHGISQVNFTPLFTLSFGLDLQLFDLDPRFFYLHHLLSISVAVALVSILLARRIPPLFAGAVVSAFVATPPLVEAAHSLMVRHYVEGLALAAAALLCFHRAERNSSLGWAIPGAVLYLAACLCKELYAPLVAVILVRTGLSRPRNWTVAVPYLAAAGVYAAWRSLMLSGERMLLGVAAHNLADVPQGFLDFPGIYSSMMAWQPIQLGLLALGLGAFTWIQLGRPGRRLETAAWAAAVALPILPVLHLAYTRYFLVLTLFLYLAAGIGLCQRPFSRVPGLVPALLLALMGFGLQSFVSYSRDHLDPHRQRLGAEGRFLMHDSDEAGVLLERKWHCLHSYQALRLQRGRSPGPGVSPTFAEAQSMFPQRASFYRYLNGEVVPFAAGGTELRTGDPEDPSKPLSVELKVEFGSGDFHWRFGPYAADAGRYLTLASSDGFFRDAPPVGSRTWPLRKPVMLHVRYRDDTGWQTTSPPLILRPEDAGPDGSLHLTWHR